MSDPSTMPLCFGALMLQAGAPKPLAKNVWDVLVPSLSQSTLSHMRQIQTGSQASMALVARTLSPAFLITAIASLVPDGQPRPSALIALEDTFLEITDRNGKWR